jgi:hypothetical protein
MANRVYFASQGLSISGTTVQGAQSVGISVNYSLEQAFQLGRLSIYDNIVTDGEVTVTATKNLDGKPLMFHLINGGNSIGNHGDTRTNIIVASNTSEADTSLNTGAQIGTAITGAYLSSLSYTFPSDGFATEEISFISDNKSASGTVTAPAATSSDNTYRHHIGWTGVHANQNVTNISISTDLGREAMFKLGTFRPYHRFANFPIEVTVEFTVANTGVESSVVDLSAVDCTTDGNLPGLTNIRVTACDVNANVGTAKYIFDMTGCRLSAVSQDGGDTGGGNASTTYTYTTYNNLTVTTGTPPEPPEE